MKLPLPKGFAPPQNARPGEPFEVVATLSQEEDGSFELEAIDGVKLADEEEEEEMPVDDRTDSTNIKLPFGEDEED